MQKRPSQQIPILYRPYNFPGDFPILAFLGDYWKTAPGAPDFLHFHNALEIGHCLRGSGKLHYPNHEYSYDCNDFSFIYPQTAHMVCGADEDTAWEYLFIEPKRFLQLSDSASDFLWQIFYLPQKTPCIIREADLPLIHRLLSHIFEEFHNPMPLQQQSLHGLFYTLFVYLNRALPNREMAESNLPPAAYSYVKTALNYIYENYAAPFSANELAAYCHISERHLRRSFCEIVGISPSEYLQHYRIQQACLLLCNNELPINLIASQVGYDSLSSFNRQFQQYLHCSPSQWKHEHLAEINMHEVLSYHERETEHVFHY